MDFDLEAAKSVTHGSRTYWWKEATAVLSRTSSAVHLFVPLLSDSVAAEMGTGNGMGEKTGLGGRLYRGRIRVEDSCIPSFEPNATVDVWPIIDFTANVRPLADMNIEG